MGADDDASNGDVAALIDAFVAIGTQKPREAETDAAPIAGDGNPSETVAISAEEIVGTVGSVKVDLWEVLLAGEIVLVTPVVDGVVGRSRDAHHDLPRTQAELGCPLRVARQVVVVTGLSRPVHVPITSASHEIGPEAHPELSRPRPGHLEPAPHGSSTRWQ